jgi:OOP family OmpA-OmpF porin
MNADGQKTVTDLSAFLQRNPAAVATIVGRTDTVGSKDYNMHLSHQRADAVRDALVYRGNVAAERVETRWTGENRQIVATANDVAAASNRVVDIAIH